MEPTTIEAAGIVSKGVNNGGALNGDYCRIRNQNDVSIGVYNRIRLNRITQ